MNGQTNIEINENEKLLEFLRKEIKFCEETSKSIAKEAGEKFDSELSVIAFNRIKGESLGYLYVIKYLKGLNQREFQTQLRKGTL